MTTQSTEQDQNLLTAAEESAAAAQADNKQPGGSQDNSAASKNSGNSGANGNGDPNTLRSELDAANSTIAALRDQASQSNLQAQIDRVEVANQAELAADQQSIEDGNLTAADATQKALNRRQNAQKAVEDIARNNRGYQQEVDQGLIARLGVAQEIAKEFDGVDADVLNLDTTLTTPEMMQNRTTYAHLLGEVADALAARAAYALSQGIHPSQILLDPGIGFAKDTPSNLKLLGHCGALRALGFPLLLGPSRKSFMSTLLPQSAPAQRDLGSAGAAAICAAQGVYALRMHTGRFQDAWQMAWSIANASSLIPRT